MAIRRAAVDDADALFVLLRRFAITYPPNRVLFDQRLPVVIDDPDSVFMVATVDDKVVGYVLAFRLQVFFANRPICEIQEIVVDHDHRKRGLGRQLVESVVEWAKANECAEVTVPTSRALEFYQSLKFVESASYLRLRLERPH